MASPKKPALPWANSAPAQPQPAAAAALLVEEEDGHEVDDRPWLPLEAVDLSVGAKVEARWQLFREDEQGQEQRSTKWWPAKVAGTKAAPEGSVPNGTDAPGPSYELVYEADEENGFASEERVVVAFLDKHTLVDLTARAASAAEGVSGQLPWRVKGDAWEPSPEDEDEEDAEGLVEEDEEEEEEEEDGMPELDPSKQRLVAEGIADIMGGFKDLVAQKLEAAGGDESAASVQISVEDVHALFSSLKEKRRRLE